MNYYEQIKSLLISNEVYKRVKDYSKNKNDIETYYNVGKLLYMAGNKYGDNVIKEYSKKLVIELGRKYSVRYLFDIRKLYLFSKVHPLGAQLSFSHYRLLFSLNNNNEIDYYINQVSKRNLSKRQLEDIIKSNEYERLPEKTKEKLKVKEKVEIKDFVPNPILIKNKNNMEIVTEKALKTLILEDIEAFMKELGDSFCFIGSEYKIKIGDRNNYIDLLLFNYKYNCFVVIELKVTEFKVEYISQVQKYMNYVDKNIKEINHNNTIGIIICKKENKFVIEYCSDPRITIREYELI
ncbi:MAG: DUF1016 family protein [Bacilli bacterium]|nr:DUF1016 family protein [Bacilli bacterium]